MGEAVTLKIALGKYAYVDPLKDGSVASERIRFEFIEYDPLPLGFRAMIRADALDVAEMAVANQLLAFDLGKPLAALAIPLWSRLPHVNLICETASKLAGPKDLEGTTCGVRAYGQTSGVWVRGVLAHAYGVDLDKIHWLTMEDAHVPEYIDPPSCSRNTTGRGLRELMGNGTLAAIMGERVVDPSGIRTVIPNAEQAAKDWMHRSGITPINHVLSVKRDLLAAHPWLGAELMALFEAARQKAAASGAEVPQAYGLHANRRSLDLACQFCAEQAVTTRRLSVDEVFETI